MLYIRKTGKQNKKEFYKELNSYLLGLLNDERDWLSGISNASALLFMLMPNINWAGFYLFKNQELILGPFQGKPACVRISVGKGVCGTAAKTQEIQIVEDVNQFPGHIACDGNSQSEIVLPIIKNGQLLGVLDIDSPEKKRFDQEDADGLKTFVEILNESIDWFISS